MIKVKSQISRRDILNHITEEEIFKYYIPDFIDIGKKFKSPFVNEKTPSCTIFSSTGRLFYKDFSTMKGGDCFNFIQQKYGLTEYESLCVVASDFNIKITDTILKNNNVILLPNKPEYKSKERVKIRVKYKKWTDGLLSYWEQYKYIDEKQLNKYFVNPISHFWVNNTRLHPDLAYCYNFSWFELYTYRILQPNEKKEFKWCGNTPDNLIQGYYQLPEKGDLLFITSSLKDVMVLDKLGFNAVAPAAEGVILKQLSIDDLSSRFKTIIAYMNNDTVGITANGKYKAQYGIEGIVNPKGLAKDPSDLARDGYDLKEMIKFLSNDIGIYANTN